MSDVQDFAAAIKKALRRDMNELADALANGAAQDFAQYKQLVGTITGLGTAERHINDLLQKVKDADE